MRDVDQPEDAKTPYECFECGTIVVTAEHPVSCSDCNAPMRNRRTPIE